MKIEIKGGERHLTIPIPGWLAFNKIALRFLVKHIGHEAAEAIPMDKAEQLFKALEQTRKLCGSWELVHIESADGEQIIITV